jgi:hypothetical protein
MNLEDEAMRWLYAVSLRSPVSAIDVALGMLLAVFLVSLWRLGRAARRQRRGREPDSAVRRPARPHDGARAGGAPVRSGPIPSARIMGAERRVVGRS